MGIWKDRSSLTSSQKSIAYREIKICPNSPKSMKKYKMIVPSNTLVIITVSIDSCDTPSPKGRAFTISVVIARAV